MAAQLEEIADDDRLYRRLAPEHIDPDGTVNSAAFKRGKQYDQSISVDLARLTTPPQVLASRPDFGLGILVASAPRSLGFTVRHDPLPDNVAHSLIEGENSRAKSRLLAEATSAVVQPNSRTQLP